MGKLEMARELIDECTHTGIVKDIKFCIEIWDIPHENFISFSDGKSKYCGKRVNLKHLPNVSRRYGISIYSTIENEFIWYAETWLKDIQEASSPVSEDD